MEVLYQDSLVEITDEGMVFQRYYFPFGNACRVPWNQIESVQVRQPSVFGGSWRLWGTGDFRTWYPMDSKRPSRDRIFVAQLRGRFRRIGFTVEDSQKVLNLLSERGLVRQ